MPHAVRRRLFLVLTGAMLGGCAAPQRAAEGTAATTIIIVRHAEKADASADPALSEAGRERAARLGAALRDAGVRTVFVSDRRRTWETAELAIAEWGAGVPTIKEYAATANAADVAAMIRNEARGSTVLVVGHSNTISPLLRSLGGWDEPPLTESEFDRMYVVVLREPGAATLVRAAYPAR